MDLISSRTENDNQSSQSDKQVAQVIKGSSNPKPQKGLLNKYSPQSQLLNKCLPAGFSHQPIYGQLNIRFSPIVFDSNASISKSKHVIYRCHMLGYNKNQQPLFSNQITYSIHTNNKMLKNYFKDMKICIVDILDARNYQPIGHCCINWLTHMRSIADQQLYAQASNDSKYEYNPNKFFLPFIDEQCIVTLPVYDYCNPKTIPLSPRHKSPQNQKFLYIKNKPHQRIIGQVQLKFSSRIYENPISQGFILFEAQNQPQEQLKSDKKGIGQKINNPNHSQIPHNQRFSSYNNAISIRNLLPDRRFSSNTVMTNYLTSNQMIPQMQRLGSNLSYLNEKSLYFKQSQQMSRQNQNKSSQNSNYNQQELQNQRGNQFDAYNRSKQNDRNKGYKTNELQLLQLKLQAQDFFKSKNSFQHNKKQQEKTILNILKLKSKLQNINQLDVFIGEIDSQFSQKPQNNNKKPKLKIYRVQTDKSNNCDIFQSKLIVDNPSHKMIQIHLPNNLGKCSFRCRDLTQTYNDICVYNKGLIIGVLTVKKQSQTKNILPTNDKNHPNLYNEQQRQKVIKQTEDKICIIMIDNFVQNFNKKWDVSQISNLDNYYVSIKNVTFYHETLNNSKLTGQYAITNSLSIPKIFAVEVKNSANQLVGMSENISFQGNQIRLIQQNIMPTLILQKNIQIKLKQMPIFKKIPNSLTLRLSIYICNTDQLNHFINKWKQNQSKNKLLQAKRQKSFSNVNKTISLKQQVTKQKQYTVSDEVISQANHNQKRLRTQSQKTNEINLKNRHTESKSSHVRESDKSRFKTHGNYTEDLKNRTLIDQRPSQMKQNQQKYSQNSQRQYQENDQDQQQEIFLVQFFSKSLHYLLSRLGSKKNIEQKISELSKFQNLDEVMKDNKVLIPKQRFQMILKVFIGNIEQNHQELLGFDVRQILQALFISEDGQMIKIQEFTLCLMAYYNFLLLLTNEKLNSFKQVFQCEPDVQNKLLRIKQSMTNISSQFLWQDVLPNVLEITKKKINKRYRIFSNTPFSVNFLLKDLKIAKKSLHDSSDESLFQNYLNIFIEDQPRKDEIFMRTTADLGNLVRQTVEQIICSNCLKNSGINLDKSWFQKTQDKMQEYIKNQNLQSISSEQKNEYCLNLNQFQQFFTSVGIQTSIWQSLMLIEEIKVWHQSDQSKDKQYFDIGEGVITFQLLKMWLKALKFKIQIKFNQNLFGQKINTKSSRLNSIKSIDSQEENMIVKMNKKQVTIKNTGQKSIQNIKVDKNPLQSESKRVQTQQNPSYLSQQKYLDQKRRKTEKNSMRQSQQSVNNQSDIANIANLLRENQNNLYFLPSMTNMNEPNNFNRMTSVKNISDSDILRGLDYNTLRNQIQALPTKKTNIQESNRLKNQKINQSESQTDKQLDQHQIHKKFKKSQPIFGYLSVSLKQIKFKKNKILKQKEGLKKLTLQIGNNTSESQNVQSLRQENKGGYEYYFITKDKMQKITDGDHVIEQVDNYGLKNIKIDINNSYELETLYNQGFSLKLFNLSTSNKKQTDAKVEQLLVSGILPIDDIVNIIQQTKDKYQSQLNSYQGEFKLSKRKTMVLYSGREVNGKAIFQVTVSNNILQNLLPVKKDVQNQKFTTVQFSYLKKELFNRNTKSKKANQVNPKQSSCFMSLAYCSIRNQNNQIQLIPKIQQNQTFEINLPEPIIEYQLILRSQQHQRNKNSQLFDENQQNYMSISRFTQIEQNRNEIKGQTSQNNEECIIPLQTLYFKKTINCDYPLIDKITGRFICTIQANLQVLETYQNI